MPLLPYDLPDSGDPSGYVSCHSKKTSWLHDVHLSWCLARCVSEHAWWACMLCLHVVLACCACMLCLHAVPAMLCLHAVLACCGSVLHLHAVFSSSGSTRLVAWHLCWYVTPDKLKSYMFQCKFASKSSALQVKVLASKMQYLKDQADCMSRFHTIKHALAICWCMHPSWHASDMACRLSLGQMMLYHDLCFAMLQSLFHMPLQTADPERARQHQNARQEMHTEHREQLQAKPKEHYHRKV